MLQQAMLCYILTVCYNQQVQALFNNHASNAICFMLIFQTQVNISLLKNSNKTFLKYTCPYIFIKNSLKMIE